MRPPFIDSLHRPFSQNLKANRWVCDFIMGKEIKSSVLNVDFYLYLIQKLNKEYSNNEIKDLNGLPSKDSIKKANDYFYNKDKKLKVDELQAILKNENRIGVEKQIYSTYKAASYYVNMAKDKFNLLDVNNKLSEDARQLTKFKSSYLNISQKENYFFVEKILEVDFLLFITLCWFRKLSAKYAYSDYNDLQFEFLNKYYGITRFNFNSRSLENYTTVRNHWIDKLGILTDKSSIKKKYLNIIYSKEVFYTWYIDIEQKIKEYEKEIFKVRKQFSNQKNLLEETYKILLKSGKGDLELVNLYDIMQIMKMTYKTFNNLLVDYYENEKGKKNIFFSNTVNSVDRRKRFEVRGVPVLKIKIK